MKDGKSSVAQLVSAYGCYANSYRKASGSSPLGRVWSFYTPYKINTLKTKNCFISSVGQSTGLLNNKKSWSHEFESRMELLFEMC